MAIIAPLIAGAFGLGSIGTALVGLGLSLALGAASRSLIGKQSASNQVRGAHLSLRYDATADREIIFGRAATAGSLVYHNLYGPNGADHLQLVFALADHECDALDEIWVDGKKVTWSAADGSVAEYPGVMSIKFYRGTYDQAAAPELVEHARDGAWTLNDRGRGVCYATVTLTYDQAKYPQGQPRFLFVVRGLRCYDWRKDSTQPGGNGAHRWGESATYEWTENPIVHAYAWRRGIWLNGQRLAGMNTPPSAFRIADWTAAANICDGLVLTAANTNEPRYRFAGVVSGNTTHRDVLAAMYETTGGTEIDSGGVIRPLPASAAGVALAVTDDDLMADGDVELSSRKPRSQLINAVFGRWRDPTQSWELVAAPPRLSPTDEALDGGVRLETTLTLENVTNPAQAQRLLEMHRRRHRRQMTVTLRLRPAFVMLEAGDWVSWTSQRHGFDGQTFEVVTASIAADLSVALTLREIDAAVFAVGATDELSATLVTPLASGGPVSTALENLALTTVTVTSATAAARPGLRLSWTPVTDLTVTHLRVEYRKQGDAVALERRIEDPRAGHYTWLDGIQGTLVYQVRVKQETSPDRATEWSPWLTAANATPVHIVDQAASVPPGAIGPLQLDAQTRFEIRLASDAEHVQGAMSDIRDEITGILQQLGDDAIVALLDADAAYASIRIEERIRQDADTALAERVTTFDARLLQADARLTTTEQAVATSTTATAQQLSTLQTRVGDTEATLLTQATSIDGIKAAYTIALDVNGRVTGIRLIGNSNATTLNFLIDALRVAAPGISGGNPIPLFSVENVNGQAQLFLNGLIRARALDVGSLSAITANFGDATFTGILRGANDKLIIDFNAPRLRMVA